MPIVDWWLHMFPFKEMSLSFVTKLRKITFKKNETNITFVQSIILWKSRGHSLFWLHIELWQLHKYLSFAVAVKYWCALASLVLFLIFLVSTQLGPSQQVHRASHYEEKQQKIFKITSCNNNLKCNLSLFFMLRFLLYYFCGTVGVFRLVFIHKSIIH
jgi:hypothetical protein